jgi:hypothetical protein
MRKSVLPIAVLTLLLFMPAAFAEKYSVRDVGFTDLETKPYRIIMVVKDLKAAGVKQQQTLLHKQIEHANVALSVFAADNKALAQELKPVKPPANVTKPLYWIVTDTQISMFDPAQSMQHLLTSPLRNDIYEKVTRSLCAVVLIESRDDVANHIARKKAEHVLQQINEVRRRFDKAPDEDVELATLKLDERDKESWTLWGLDENVKTADKPKLAVFYGKMRRAGPLLEGTDWKEETLFARIAILAQTWEADARPQVAGPALPYASSAWPGKESLGFDPIQDADKIKLILSKAPVKNSPPRKLRYADWQEAPPPAPPPVPPAALEPVLPRSPAPPLISSTPIGVVFLIVGVLGWIALGACVWLLEQKQQPHTK